MLKKPASINLVKQKINYLDEFIKWALSIGRLLVIVTEIVALLTFLYRFSLDRQLIDLHTKIVQEQAIVSSLKDQEQTYRNLQDRIALANTTSLSTSKKIQAFFDIQKNAPSELIFNNMSLSEQGVRFSISTRNVSSLSKFINFLKSYKDVSSVSIDKIENKASAGTIQASISIAFLSNKF